MSTVLTACAGDDASPDAKTGAEERRTGALVLDKDDGTDGAIHVIDPASGDIEKKIPAVGTWQEPLDRQQPRPALFVRGGTAYVSDPSEKAVHAIDLETGEKVASATLPQSTDELSGVVAGH